MAGPLRMAGIQESLRLHLQRAIAALPPAQREVITLRDIEQWSSQEVCNDLGISETNQRVLLHRARSRVRRAVEEHFSAKVEHGRATADGWHPRISPAPLQLLRARWRHSIAPKMECFVLRAVPAFWESVRPISGRDAKEPADWSH